MCILPKWGVGEDKDITLPPTRGQVLQSSPVGHLHARRRVDAPCLTVNHEVVFTNQAFLLSIIFSLLACPSAWRVGYARQRTVSPVRLPQAGNGLLLTRHSGTGLASTSLHTTY